MTYNYNGKNFTIPDVAIDTIMEKMTDISLSEACELYLFDKGLIDSEEVNSITDKATKNRITATIHKAKGEKKNPIQREKKVNTLKREIINSIFTFLSKSENLNFTINEIKVTNSEKYIDFISDDRDFSINLIEHRKKKG